MKKILFSMMLAALCATSYANKEEAQKMDEAGRNMIAPLGTAGLIILAAEKFGTEFGFAPTVVKTVDLTSTLMSLGIAFDSPTFRDYAIRAPLVVGTTHLAKAKVLQQVALKMPFGIGTALAEIIKGKDGSPDIVKLSEDGKILVGIALYESITKPVYEKLRDDTKIGRFVVHGEGF